MIAVGIDISKAKSTVAVIDSDGTVLASPFTMAHTQPDERDRKSTRLNSSHDRQSRMPSSA